MVDIANFRFDDSNGSFEGGYKKQAQIMDDQARARAGNALTAGNYRGAADELYGNGDLQLGSQVQGAGEARALAAQQRKDQQRLSLLKFTGEAFQNLAAVHQQNNGDPTKTVAAFDLLAPQFAQFGEPPEEIARVRSALAADTVGTLTALRDGVAKEMEPFTLNPGDQRFVGNKVVASVAPKQEYQAVPEGGMLVPVPQAGQPAPIQPAPQQAPVPAPAAAPTGQPRSVRNANPGNIEDGPWARSLPGYKGSDGRFAIFEDDNAGANAQAALLTSYGKRGLNTVSSIINRWAPPSENDTNAYVDFVAKKVGVGPNQQLDMSDPATISDVAMAIRQFEGGAQSRSNAPAPQQAQAPQVQPAQAAPGAGPPGTIYGRPKPTVRTLSPQEVAAQGFLPGTIVQQKPDGSLDTVQSPNNTAGPRKAEADLRKELTQRPEIKDFRAVKTSFQQIQALASKPPTAAGDLSLIFSYMKMLDPGSVVREGEFATAQNAAGIPEQVQNAYNKALNGQRLNPKQRADFLAQANSIYGTQSARYNQIVDEYRGYAEDYGIEPDRVATKEEAAKPKPPQGARLGRSGKYYIADPNKPGSFPEIRQGPNGTWQLKSANGKTLEWID